MPRGASAGPGLSTVRGGVAQSQSPGLECAPLLVESPRIVRGPVPRQGGRGRSGRRGRGPPRPALPFQPPVVGPTARAAAA